MKRERMVGVDGDVLMTLSFWDDLVLFGVLCSPSTTMSVTSLCAPDPVPLTFPFSNVLTCHVGVTICDLLLTTCPKCPCVCLCLCTLSVLLGTRPVTDSSYRHEDPRTTLHWPPLQFWSLSPSNGHPLDHTPFKLVIPRPLPRWWNHHHDGVLNLPDVLLQMNMGFDGSVRPDKDPEILRGETKGSSRTHTTTFWRPRSCDRV